MTDPKEIKVVSPWLGVTIVPDLQRRTDPVLDTIRNIWLGCLYISIGMAIFPRVTTGIVLINTIDYVSYNNRTYIQQQSNSMKYWDSRIH